MIFAIVIFCLIFVLFTSAGLLLFHGERASQEIAMPVLTQQEEKTTLSTKFQTAAASLGTVVGQLEGIMPKSDAERSVIQQRMIRAGLRRDSAVKIFYGAKIVAMIGLVILTWISGLAAIMSYFLSFTLALVIGYLGPDFWLTNKIKARQKQIRLGLPDVLDLLIVCVEAGLSLDQATSRTAEELSKSQSAVGDELTMVVLEQRAGCPRADAWRHFADRSDVPNVRNVVSMLIQSEQFGTSIAKTLRVHSETMRTQRIQQVEEAAAKTTIKILFPLVLLIFPSIFVVVLGPAVILVMESFQH